MAVTGDFFNKVSETSPPKSVSHIFDFLVAFLYFSLCFPLEQAGCLKIKLIMVYVVSERPAVCLSGPMVDPEGLSSGDTAEFRLALELKRG